MDKTQQQPVGAVTTAGTAASSAVAAVFKSRRNSKQQRQQLQIAEAAAIKQKGANQTRSTLAASAPAATKNKT